MTALGRRVTLYQRRFLTGERHHGDCRAPFDGRRFRNEIDTTRWAQELMRWLTTRRPDKWPKWIDDPVQRPPPAAQVAGAELRVTFVNHATVLVQTGGLNFLTDPVWSRRVGPFPWLGAPRVRAPGIAFADLPKIDWVLLSHDHYDHLDVRTLKRLAARDRPRIACGLGVERTLAIEGLTGAHPLDWWEGLALAAGTPGPGGDGALRLTFTPSRHFSGRGLQDQDATLWGSFVLETPRGPLYFAGDTGYGPHFAAVRRRFGPVACALLPVGCYEPRWFMEPFHMSPSDAVRAHQDLEAAVSIGIHHGTFQLGDEGIEAPGRALAAAGAKVGLATGAFRLLGFGEELAVPPVDTSSERGVCAPSGSLVRIR